MIWSLYLVIILGVLNHSSSEAVYERVVVPRLAQKKCNEYLELKAANDIDRLSDCPSFRVAGGEMVFGGAYPHMALVGYASPKEDGQELIDWLCGGSIISMRFILTAAHCIKTAQGSPTHVRIGDLNHESSADEAAPETICVAKAIPHEQYRPPVMYNDIGLLELAHNIKATKFARPACLNLQPRINITAPFMATGWGHTEFSGLPSAALMQVKLQQFSTRDCSKAYQSSRQLPSGLVEDSQLCAGSRYEMKDTCEGDSGGPLQILHEKANCLFYVVGVTSYGKACGVPSVPGIYSRVSHFIDWIEERAFVHG